MKNIKRLTTCLLAVMLVMAMAPGAAFAAAAVKTTGVKTLTFMYVAKGKSVRLPWLVSPTNASNKAVKWQSADRKTATVTADGVVKGIKAGKTTVAVKTKSGGKTSVCRIYVVEKPIAVKSVAVTRASGNKKSAQFRAVVEPFKATGAVVKWKSSNTSVAKIDAFGRVTKVKNGKTTISAAVGGKTAKMVQTFGLHKIALITMDSSSQYWVSMNQGAMRAAKGSNVEFVWMAPYRKEDALQIRKINDAVAWGADAIMIAANGPYAVTSAIEKATAKGVKIIYVDSPADFAASATVSTNNKEAGKTAGTEMLKALKAKGITKGKLGVVSVNSSTQSVVDRDKGFREAIKGSGFEILATKYSEGDAELSKKIAGTYITKGVVGIYGTNEGCTVGTGESIKDLGKGKKIVGIGWDLSDATQQLLNDGYLYCVLTEKPDQMGYQGLKLAIMAIEGKKIAKPDVDSGVKIVTKKR